MWMRDPVTILVPPKRQLQMTMPEDLQGVLTADQWNKLRADVESAFSPLTQKLAILHPLSNTALILSPVCIIASCVLLLLPLLQEGLDVDKEGVAANIWKFITLLLVGLGLGVFGKEFLPRLVRKWQGPCYASLKEDLAKLSKGHPGWTFDLEQKSHTRQVGQQGGGTHEVFTHYEVSIVYGVGVQTGAAA